MLCKKCGATVPDTTYKCPFCKAKLGDEPMVDDEVIEEEPVQAEESSAEPEIDNEEIFDENEMNRREQVKRMLDEKQQQLSEIQDRRETKKKKQQRNKTILVAVICVLVSIAVGTGAYLISNGMNNNRFVVITPAPETTEEPLVSEEPIETVDPSASPEVAEETSPSPETGQAWQAADTDSTSSTSTSKPNSSGTAGTTSKPNSSGTTGATSKSNSSGKTGATSKSNSSGKTGATSKSNSSGKTGATSKSNSSVTSKVVNTGITTKAISGMIVKGSAVVYDGTVDKYVMSFVSDGTEYYAYVSPGSTTAQVANKTIKISAVPSENTYKGSTVYTVTDITYMSGDCIIADSSTRLLTETDLAGLTKEQLGYARNEIFARHGRPFKTQKYKDYFAKCSWYKVNSDYNLGDDKSNLNSIERQNVDFILMHEN